MLVSYCQHLLNFAWNKFKCYLCLKHWKCCVTPSASVDVMLTFLCICNGYRFADVIVFRKGILVVSSTFYGFSLYLIHDWLLLDCVYWTLRVLVIWRHWRKEKEHFRSIGEHQSESVNLPCSLLFRGPFFFSILCLTPYISWIIPAQLHH